MPHTWRIRSWLGAEKHNLERTEKKVSPMFEVAEAYERQRGRSSKLLAPLFADFARVGGEVLDVGCGTGALTFAIAKNPAVSKTVGMDLSDAFLAYARAKTRRSTDSF